MSKPSTDCFICGCDDVDNSRANAKTLKIRQSHHSRNTINIFRCRMWSIQHAAEDGGSVVDETHEASGGTVQIGTQIVIRSEARPLFVFDPTDLNVDAGASLNRPPGEGSKMRLDDPIRLKPVDDVVMAPDGDELFARPPDVLCDGCGSDLRHLPVHNGRELVDDDDVNGLDEAARKIDPELLAGREHMKGPHPRRNRVKADRSANVGDRVHAHAGREVVDDGLAAPCHGAINEVAEHGPRHGRLSGPAWAHDDADAPRRGLNVGVDGPFARLLFAGRTVEHPFKLADPR